MIHRRCGFSVNSRLWLACLLACAGLLLLLPLNLYAVAPPVPRATTPNTLQPLHQQIDRLLAADADFSLTKAPLADDAEFLRRVYLDLTGSIPSSATARAFLADRSPHKRTVLIDKLLLSPDYSRRMATVFDVMIMERLPMTKVPVASWQTFLHSSFTNNLPWDVLAKEILSGDDTDPKTRHRAAFFLERNAEPHLLTRDISRLFLGMNYQCAQCHDHPRIDDYKQDEYYGLFAFVQRTSLLPAAKGKAVPISLTEKADGEASFQSVFDPKKVTKTSLPRVPGGMVIKDPELDKTKLYRVAPAPGVVSVPSYSRRSQLAGAIARSDSAPFRRNIANRLWAQLTGRGLVEPLDMDHSSNPPSHPELLDALSADIAARKFDMRGMMREILLSEAYQRSSEAKDELQGKKPPLYAVAHLKPLSPEQFALSLMQATGYTDTQRLSLGAKADEPTLFARLAPQIPPFVKSFSTPAGMPQTFDARMEHALFLANGPTVRSWLVDRPGSLLQRLAKLSGDALAEELYLSIFTRLPDDEEKRELAEFLKRKPGKIADFAWAQLASTEFRFNH